MKNGVFLFWSFLWKWFLEVERGDVEIGWSTFGGFYTWWEGSWTPWCGNFDVEFLKKREIGGKGIGAYKVCGGAFWWMWGN